MEKTKIDALLRDAGWPVKSSRLVLDTHDPEAGIAWYEVILSTGNCAQVQAPNEWDAFQNANWQLRDNETRMRQYE